MLVDEVKGGESIYFKTARLNRYKMPKPTKDRPSRPCRQVKNLKTKNCSCRLKNYQ